MQNRLFKQVDVFTATPYLGNPLAVVLDGNGLTDEAMQAFARWTNLSETTFLLPPTQPTADYRVRIFTPGGELPFAGHPTLGSCHAWLEAGGQPRQAGMVVQECAKGLVPIRRDNAPHGRPRLAFAAPAMARSAPSPVALAQIAAALGLKATQIRAAQFLDNGPVWLGLLLENPTTVLQLQPDHIALKHLGFKVGVAARYDAEPTGTPTLIGKANREARAFLQNAPVADAPGLAPDLPNLEVRAFVDVIGVPEDPVTGSLNASLAQWLMADGILPERYIAAQGTCLERAGLVYLERDPAGQVWVGGDVVTCIDGRVTL
jgi:PhzF family phenazine biosynthesis protein